MQANEFEKNIRQKMEGFQLVPGEEVWKQVEIRIAKEKRRRRVIYWWFTGILLVGGVGGWWLLSGNNNTAGIVQKLDGILNREEKLPVKKEQAATNSRNKKVQADDKQIAKEALNYPTAKGAKVAETGKSGVQKSGFARAIGVAAGEGKAKKTGDERQPKVEVLQKTKTGAELLEESERSYLEDAMTELHSLSTADSATKPLVIAEKANLKNDSSASSTTKEIKRIANDKTKKWNIGITAYVGFSDNRSGFPLIEKSNPLSYYNAFPSQSSGGWSGVSSIAPLTYTSGLSFGFGLFTSVRLNKRTTLSLGVDYHYYSSKSTVGNSTGSQNNFLYDSLLLQSVYLNTFYAYGKSSTFSNTYHLVELPVNLMFQVNRSIQHPFFITAGISPGYLINSNALYANMRSNIYYVEKNQFNRLQVSAQVGLLYSFINAKKYRISAGPVLQYGFRNLSRSVTGTNQHLLFTGLKTTISLK